MFGERGAWIATIAALAVAVVAAVFAIWPVIADAPWEDEATPPSDRARELRCEGAMAYRTSVIDAFGAYSSRPPAIQQEPLRGRRGSVAPLTDLPPLFQDQLDEAEREIARYCDDETER